MDELAKMDWRLVCALNLEARRGKRGAGLALAPWVSDMVNNVLFIATSFYGDHMGFAQDASRQETASMRENILQRLNASNSYPNLLDMIGTVLSSTA